MLDFISEHRPIDFYMIPTITLLYAYLKLIKSMAIVKKTLRKCSKTWFYGHHFETDEYIFLKYLHNIIMNSNVHLCAEFHKKCNYYVIQLSFSSLKLLQTDRWKSKHFLFGHAYKKR